MENWVYYIEDVGYFIMILSWVCAVVCCAHEIMSWCHACIVFHSVSSLVAISSPPCPSFESVPAQTSVLNQGPVSFIWTLQWSGPLCLPGWGLFHASSLSSHYWCPEECCTFPITVLIKILCAFSSFHRHVFQSWLFSNTLDCFPSQICWRPDYAKEYK